MNNSGGIKELMNAETQASQIVSAARSGRGTRLKAAKSEAQTSIDNYRSQKEVAFNEASLNTNAGDDASRSALKAETAREMQSMEAKFNENQGEALKVLLAKCCDVNLDVPAARVRSAQKAAM
ncbi:hypothetical protein ScalyP_jg1444 [Parmales sp. scaly parma]|nr:hypothetical protein ScalyP_jg1444 [Parmales sp. scaly parma]